MKKKICRNLLFFVNDYPYGSSESFIDNELKIMSSRFSNIFLICTKRMKNNKLRITLPNNIIKIDKFIYDWDSKYFKPLIRTLFGDFFNQNIKNNWKLISSKEHNSLLNKAYYCYLYERENIIIKYVVNELKKFDLNVDNTMIYSYWFNDTAYVASLINKILFDNKLLNVSRAHSYDLYDERNKRYSPLKTISMKEITKVYACSKNGMEYLIDKYPEYKNKIYYSYLGTIDNGLCSNKTIKIFRICSCSLLTPIKRIDRLIDALQKIDFNVEWVHFGGGVEFNKINKLSKKLHNNIKVILMGTMQNEKILNYYKNNHIDIFVNVSSMEGIPVSIMEAMSFGIPIIATDVGGTSELVGNDNGILLKKDFTTDELVKAINDLYGYPREKLSKMRDSNRKKWSSCFNCIHNYEDFYINLEKLYNMNRRDQK